MLKLRDVPMSQNPKLPHADITNAAHLFGDPDYGDPDYGDPDYGDPESGDLNPLAVFHTISGDPSEQGGFHLPHLHMPKHIPKWGKYAGAAALAGGAFLGGRALYEAIKKHRAKEAQLHMALQRAHAQQTLVSQRNVQQNVPSLPRNTMFPFFSLRGAKLNSSPIDPLSQFPTDMFKVLLDRQNSDTPFYQETAIGTFAAGTWTAQAVGIPAGRYFTGLILQIGTNILNAAPGTVISITATIPTIAGPLVISSLPFLLTYEKDFDVRFMFFPWTLVSNKPLPVLGLYDNANPITVTVTGIPSQSAVNLIVPGSLHPWTVAMRNALGK